ncbi:MAG TPA: energy transducer TonB [Steroidobacteraceae bacterium]|nr:energy transducer TonB [Steroidobacteraceae bacterium]
MGVYTHSDGNWLTRRGAFLVALILFHLVLFWALKSGFAVKFIESITEPIKVDIVNEVKDEEPPPPPPPPKMEMPPVQIPPPVVDITIQQDVSTTALTNVTDKPPPPAPPPPVVRAAVVRTQLKLNPKSSQPNVDDYYPETSRRLEEEGLTKVKVCVGTNGRVKNAEVDETSSFARLDEAAIKVAKLLRFTPPTEDGKPLDDACGTVPIRFQLPKK